MLIVHQFPPVAGLQIHSTQGGATSDRQKTAFAGQPSNRPSAIVTDLAISGGSLKPDFILGLAAPRKVQHTAAIGRDEGIAFCHGGSYGRQHPPVRQVQPPNFDGSGTFGYEDKRLVITRDTRETTL